MKNPASLTVFNKI